MTHVFLLAKSLYESIIYPSGTFKREKEDLLVEKRLIYCQDYLDLVHFRVKCSLKGLLKIIKSMLILGQVK